MPRSQSKGKSRIGLALAGGGPEGSIYELGALRAIDEAFEGIDFNELDIYVGVSAGAFVASCLVNDISTSQLCRSIVAHEPGEHPFHPEYFYAPAIGEIVRGGFRVPRLFAEALWDYVRNPEELTLLESMTRLARALPVGLFRNEPIRRYLEGIFKLKDRSNDFRELDRKLVVVAVDLDSGEATRFGEPGLDHVPISRAVQASTALPGMYPPVLIDGRHYVDGVLLKTLHASVALDESVDLLICVNPIVPVDTARSVETGAMRSGRLINRGLPTVMSQTFRTLIHSRLVTGMQSYEPRYPDQDFVLLEPDRDDYRMFFTNIFRFSSRKDVCEHAYDSTRKQLLARRETLEPMLAKHGVKLRVDLLEDESHTLWKGLGFHESPSHAFVTQSLDAALNRLEKAIERL